MATKGKGDGQTVKELKRGTSPYPRHSDPRPAAAAAVQCRRSPTPAAAAATTSSDHKCTVATEKQVPNYLKPTKSSTHDPSKPSPKKQPFTDFTTPKTSSPLTRRRSFDKPPSPSRIPKPNATSPNSAEKSLRSSSFSSKTTPLPKTQLEKLSKATKEPIRASNVRKSIVTYSKKQNGASSSTRTSTSKATKATSPLAITDNSLKLELQHKDDESPPTDATEDINGQKLPAEIIQLVEDHKEHVNVDHEAEMDESEELKHCDSCTVPEDQNASLPVDMEESQGETPTEENVNNHQEADQERSKEESVESHHQKQGGTATASELEVDGEKKEAEEEETASALAPKENSSELKEEIKKSKEVPKSEETAPVERLVANGSDKPGEAENVVKKIQGGSANGKKDTAVYNDVIEETASKLREQRKNKVKALVGAFETVISLESDATAE